MKVRITGVDECIKLCPALIWIWLFHSYSSPWRTQCNIQLMSPRSGPSQRLFMPKQQPNMTINNTRENTTGLGWNNAQGNEFSLFLWVRSVFLSVKHAAIN